MADNLFDDIGRTTTEGGEDYFGDIGKPADDGLFGDIGQRSPSGAPEPSKLTEAWDTARAAYHRIADPVLGAVGAPKRAVDLAVGYLADRLDPTGQVIKPGSNEAGQLLERVMDVNPVLGPARLAGRAVAEAGADLAARTGHPTAARAARTLLAADEAARTKAAELASDPAMYLLPESKLVGAAFLPGAVEGAVEGTREAARQYQAHGVSPEAARPAVGAAVDAAMSGLIGAHLLTPGTRPANVEVLPPAPLPPERGLPPAGGSAGPVIDVEARPVGPRALLESEYPVNAQVVPPPPGQLPPPAGVRPIPLGPEAGVAGVAGPGERPVVPYGDVVRAAQALLARGLPSERNARMKADQAFRAEAAARADEDLAKPAVWPRAAAAAGRPRAPLPPAPPLLLDASGHPLPPFVPPAPDVLGRLRDFNARDRMVQAALRRAPAPLAPAAAADALRGPAGLLAPGAPRGRGPSGGEGPSRDVIPLPGPRPEQGVPYDGAPEPRLDAAAISRTLTQARAPRAGVPYGGVEPTMDASAMSRALAGGERRGEGDVRTGVQRYIEDHPQATREQLAGEIRRLREQVAQVQAARDLDEMTGARNRDAYLRDTRDLPPPPAVSEFDLAGVGDTNKSYGEHYADAMISAGGRALVKAVGTRGKVYRKGGDELVVHWNDADEGARAHEEVAQSLAQAHVVVEGEDGRPEAAWTGVGHYGGFGRTFREASARVYEQKPADGSPGYKKLPAEIRARIEAGRQDGARLPAGGAGVRGGGPDRGAVPGQEAPPGVAPAEVPVSLLSRVPAEPLATTEEGAKAGSLARARENLQAGKRYPVQVSIRDDGTPVISDGRHTLQAAREAGVESLPLRVLTADGRETTGADAREILDRALARVAPPAGATPDAGAKPAGGVPSDQEASGVRTPEPPHGPAGQGPRPLAAVPAEDVPRPPAEREAAGGGAGGGPADEGRVPRPDREERPGGSGVGGGEGAVGVPSDRGGRPGTRDLARRDDRPGDYRISADDRVGSGSLATKAKGNIEALRTLKKIEEEGRPATAEEQAKLVRYVGWGGMPQMFDYYPRDEWKGLQEELKGLLTDDEHASAKASTPNAHYTSPVVIDAMWQAARRFGLQPGASLLEPSMGVGHFFGLQPDDLAVGAKRTGIELDQVTGRIAALLYPRANVHVQGFEAVPLPDNHFDLAISNVPFGNYGIHDPRYKRAPQVTRSIHDYFFAKAVDKVRPGGVVAFITSHHTMDKGDSAVRRYLAERADLVGAIRLPNTAFKGNAGTEVTTDIIFLKKRAPGAAPAGEAWTGTQEIDAKDGRKVAVNEYFARHPEMMLGDMTLAGSMYRSNEPTLEGTLTPEKLAAAVARLPEGVITPRETRVAEPARVVAMEVGDAGALKEGAFAVRDGSVFVRRGGELHEAALSADAGARVRGMVGVRDALRDVFRAQLGETSDADLAGLRKKLNTAYDAYVKKHGFLNDRRNRTAFEDDPDAPLLLSLENWDPDEKTATKADIFTKRTLQRYQPVTHVDSAPEALTVALNERGRIDWDHMATLTGKRPEELQQELHGLVYENPEGSWETSDEYLSGDVRAKLAAAREAAKLEPKYRSNVDALAKVQPADLEPHDIDARLGATWIPTDDVRDFIAETLGVHPDNVIVRHSEEIAAWTVQVPGWARSSVAMTETWGTQRATAESLVEDALNQRVPTIYDRIDKDKTVVNTADTAQAREQQEKLKARFREWVWQQPERATRLARKYNDEFNNLRLREFDGAHLTFPGMARLALRGGDLAPHQKNAVWRILQHRGNTLLAHVVGAGKTYEMVAAGMEMRRVGLARKPLYVVPNHLVEQWGAEFLRLYPTANILVAGKEHFEKGRREQAMSRIATGNYDAVIVSHRSFESLPIGDDTFNGFLREQIDALEQVILKAQEEESGGRRGRSTSRIVKELEKAKKRLEAKLRGKANREAKDRAVTFEELGIDALFVDEAHAFKNLFFPSKQRVAGLPQTESNRAFDMYVKARYLTRMNGGRGVVFATGTPVTNTMAEMYTMQRYLQPEYLEQAGLQHFDGWAANFGETVTGIELSPDGSGYRTHTRFAKFTNLPELLSAFRTFADVKTAADLNLPRPKLAGGKPELVAAPQSPQLKEYVASLVARADAIRKRMVRPDEDNMLAVTGDGRKAALDMRLVNPKAEDDPNGKVALAARRITDIWKATKRQRSTQLVFIDLSTPADAKERGTRFTAYDDLRSKLVRAGIPDKEIAFIHDADTDARKQALFNAVNTGRVRVLMGSTEKMGAGTNVQRKLVALHHLDAPWRPSDIEQREGRILRQGNENPEVHVIRYVTQGSFDAYMWQTLETKSRFISQVMRGDSSVRSAEDVDGGPLTYAEVKAIASGNPEVIEKVKVDSEIRKLDQLRSAHLRARSRQRAEIVSLPDDIARGERALAAYRADEKLAARKPEGEFSITIQGQTYDDRAKANEALKALADAHARQTGTFDLGTFRGFDVQMVSFGSQRQLPSLQVRGEAVHSVGTLGVGSIEHTVAHIGDRAAGQERVLADQRRRLADLKVEVGKPFEHQARLAQLLEKQAALESKLDLDKGDAQAAASSEEGSAAEPAEGAIESKDALGRAADAARERIRQRGKDTTANDLGSATAQGAAATRDAAIIGADWLARGIREAGAWARRMVSEFGAGIRRWLGKIRPEAERLHERVREAERERGRTGAPRAEAGGARQGGGTSASARAWVGADQVRRLRDLGFSDEQIGRMRPEEAERIIREGRAAGTGGAAEREWRRAQAGGTGGRGGGRPPADQPPMGRPMEPGEGPRVEEKEARLREAEAFAGIDHRTLERDAPRTWRSLDPEVRRILRTADAETLLRKAAAGHASDAETMALDAIQRAKYEAFQRAAERARRARESGGGVGQVDADALAEALRVAAMDAARTIRADVEGGTRVARALAARARIMEAGRSVSDAFLRRVFREVADITDEQAADFLRLLEEDPALLPDALRAAMRPSGAAKWLELWKAGLVSAPGTQIANILGNVGEFGMRLGETLVAPAVDRILGSEGRSRFSGEMRAEVEGAVSSMGQAWRRLVSDLRSIRDLEPERVNLGGGKLEQQVGAIGGKTGRAVRIPFRLLDAFDNFFKTVGGDAELGKLAWRKARAELGESADAARVKARAAEIVNEALDPESGAHMDILQAVAKARLERTFQGDPHHIVQGLIQMRSRSKWLHVIAPFIRTPANIAELTIERTPLGFLRARRAYKAFADAERAGVTGEKLAQLRGQAVDAIARPLLGTALMAGVAMLAKAGLMTGSGPTDPRQRNALRDTGWQPYSLAIPVGNGRRLYIPFNRFEPVSSLLGMASDAAEIQNEQKAGDIFDKALGSVVQNITSKTYLQGLTDAAEAVSDPTHMLGRYVSNLAGSVVPNIVAKGAQAIDPALRDVTPESAGLAGVPDRIFRTIAARIPGASFYLPARRGPTGEDVERTGDPFSRLLLPSQASLTRTDRDVEAELARIGYVPSAPDREFHAQGKLVRYSDEEYALLREADRRAAAAVERLMRAPAYNELPDTIDDGGPRSKEARIRHIYESYRDAARKRARAKALARQAAA